MSYLLIALGSAFGGVARYGLSIWISGRTDSALPWGTILVNVSGSFMIGAIAGADDEAELGHPLRNRVTATMERRRDT